MRTEKGKMMSGETYDSGDEKLIPPYHWRKRMDRRRFHYTARSYNR